MNPAVKVWLDIKERTAMRELESTWWRLKLSIAWKELYLVLASA